jgi:hypothetical protein
MKSTTARKITSIYYKMVTEGVEFDPQVLSPSLIRLAIKSTKVDISCSTLALSRASIYSSRFSKKIIVQG